MIIVEATMPVMRPIDVDSPAKVVKVAVPDASMKASAPAPRATRWPRGSLSTMTRRGRGGAVARRDGRVPTAVTTTQPRRSPTPPS